MAINQNISKERRIAFTLHYLLGGRSAEAANSQRRGVSGWIQQINVWTEYNPYYILWSLAVDQELGEVMGTADSLKAN